MTRYLGGALGIVVSVIMSMVLEIHAQACVYPYHC